MVFICPDAFLLLDRSFFLLLLLLLLFLPYFFTPLIVRLFCIESRQRVNGEGRVAVGWPEMLYGNMSHQLSNWAMACNWLVFIHRQLMAACLIHGRSLIELFGIF